MFTGAESHPLHLPLLSLASAHGNHSDVTGTACIILVSSVFHLSLYHSDSVAARTFPNGVGVVGQVTIESCTEACFNAGFSLAGAEYADQCCTHQRSQIYCIFTTHNLHLVCGNSFENSGAPIAASSCNMLCAGNSSEFCGGPNALNVYNYTKSSTPSGTPPPPAPTGPIVPSSVGGWVSLGCYK